MRELAAMLGVSHGALYRWVKNRDELFHLVSEALVDRILTAPATNARGWRRRLTHIAWLMHDEFLALPGYATHLARPHKHNSAAADRLETAIVTAFLDAGATEPVAEQSYYIFLTSIISWLAFQENSHGLGPHTPRFELLLDTLLRGLPPRDIGIPRPDSTGPGKSSS